MHDDRNACAARRLLPLALMVAAALALPACGGGGADPAPAAAAQAAPSAANAATAADAGCGIPDFAQAMLKAVNDARAQARVCGNQPYIAAAPLAWNDRLFAAAAGHAGEMAQKNYFGHDSADGSTFDKRLQAAGYRYLAAGENIAAGHADIDAVMQGWLASAGHCANLMNAQFKEIGVACVQGIPGVSSYGTYWTMDLAAPR
jgi:uncharacterized protein YkwD